jgi:type VI secretion system secreted protein VgrG
MDRNVTVTTPLPDGVLLIDSMAGREDLGRPFTYRVDLLSSSADIDPAALLGQPMTVHLETPAEDPRHFNGIICRFDEVGVEGNFTRYRAVLRPWVQLLTNATNCRIFQKGDAGKDPRTVPNIVKEVCDDQQFKDIDLMRLATQQYREWEFLVQYRESDFNFISRMMEQEGIYYYFTHTADRHVLVLADAPSSHDPIPGDEVIPFHRGLALLDLPADGKEFLHSFVLTRNLEPGAYVLNDYNFESPRTDRLVRSSAPLDQNFGTFEMFDYPGEYSVRAEGEVLVGVRREEVQVESELYQGTGNDSRLAVGSLFRVTGHPRQSVNEAEFLITGATHSLKANPLRSQAAGSVPTYHCSFTAIDTRRAFRAASRTPKPAVQGPQTAVVVGPDDQEIWTDKYGRVKVQFPWDRFGASDENSSCWVRVSQAWAGAKWGAMHIPRIGQEVIVDFLEGDPDRPIVTGRVYNNDQMPPYDLPDNKTQSGIKSRSTPKGTPSNFNEIRFEDKKGSEELFIQAERSQTTLVKGSQSISVGGDRSVSVTGKETIDVQKTRMTTIALKETENFNDAREMNVAKTDTETITGKMTGNYNAGRELTVNQFDDTTVNGGNKTTTVHGQFNITADELFKVLQGSTQIFVKDQVYIESNGEVQLKNGKCWVDLKDGFFTVTGPDQIMLTSGSSSISLKKDGTIEIKGLKVTVTGSTEVDVSGAQIKLNG